MILKRIELRITGRVQGVFFRARVKQEADELGLTGRVRNEPDGSVHVVAEGNKENLQKLIEWCRKGTEWAKVENVEVWWQKAQAEFEGFTIK